MKKNIPINLACELLAQRFSDPNASDGNLSPEDIRSILDIAEKIGAINYQADLSDDQYLVEL